MKPIKARLKKQLCIQHRKTEYLKAINRVIDGEAEPEYATRRWQKLQEIQK